MGYALELVKIFELLSSGARIDPLPEHVVLHVQPVRPDLILHPLDIRLRRLDPAPNPASSAAAAAAVAAGHGGGVGAGAGAGGEGEEEEEEEDGGAEDGEHEDGDGDDHASLGSHGCELGALVWEIFSRAFAVRDPIWGF